MNERNNNENIQANKLLLLIVAKRVNELRKQTPTLTEEQAQQIAIDELLNKISKEKEKK
jgi:hypothetical protein